jgi:pyruvate/2-oxoglutarate/acetoin dehydrogenase E1 component
MLALLTDAPLDVARRPVQITKGLLQKYGADRVKDTPITEVGT